jgi:uncharacterized membrane protein
MSAILFYTRSATELKWRPVLSFLQDSLMQLATTTYTKHGVGAHTDEVTPKQNGDVMKHFSTFLN